MGAVQMALVQTRPGLQIRLGLPGTVAGSSRLPDGPGTPGGLDRSRSSAASLGRPDTPPLRRLSVITCRVGQVAMLAQLHVCNLFKGTVIHLLTLVFVFSRNRSYVVLARTFTLWPLVVNVPLVPLRPQLSDPARRTLAAPVRPRLLSFFMTHILFVDIHAWFGSSSLFRRAGRPCNRGSATLTFCARSFRVCDSEPGVIIHTVYRGLLFDSS